MELIPESEYYTCVKNLPIAAVDVVIFNKEKNKLLLFKRQNEPAKGKYCTPGGRINKNEKMVAAAIRKLKEEIGLEASPKELIYAGVSEEFFPNNIFGRIKSHFIVINYALILKDNLIKKFKLDSQHNEFKWFDTNDKAILPYVKNKIRMIKIAN